MPTTIHLIHGIHTSRKSRRMADLAPIVEEATGRRMRNHEYGDIWGIQTRAKNPGIAEGIRKLIQPGDDLVGFSNGAAIGARILLAGAPVRRFVILNGALRDDFDFSRLPNLEQIDVYFNDDDGATPWAVRPWPWLHVLTDPLWGDMGTDGYKGDDYRVSQFDCEHTPGMPPLRGHSAILNKPEAIAWTRFWSLRLR